MEEIELNKNLEPEIPGNKSIQVSINEIKKLDDIFIKNLRNSFEDLCQAIVDAQAVGLKIEIHGFNGKVKEPFPNYNPVKLIVNRDINLLKRKIF